MLVPLDADAAAAGPLLAVDARVALPAMADGRATFCLLYTSDAADERSSVDLGGRRIIKNKQKKKKQEVSRSQSTTPTRTLHRLHLSINA